MKLRKQIAAEDTWDLSPLYKNKMEWEEEFKKLETRKWQGLLQFQGRLGESAEILKSALEASLGYERTLEKLYTYMHLCFDVDITEDGNKSALDRITGLLFDYQERTAWFEPELLGLPDAKIQTYLKDKVLSPYHFLLEKKFRQKPHVLTAREEELFAMAGQSLQAARKSFSALNDADFTFGTAKDEEGKEHQITHASYRQHLESHDRTLRKNVFHTYLQVYKKHENTLCELLKGQVNNHVFHAKARRYPTCLDAALFGNKIPTKVYHALIETVRENLEAHREYITLRKKLLGNIDLHFYDLFVPLSKEIDFHFTYQQAEDMVIASVAPLGAEYQNILRKGMKEQRWSDRYENKNKRSGAYSSGCYDSYPYMLMNFKGTMRDVFTLAHEAGHSMHSYLSHKTQPYHYSNYPIFLAEVASTFNEELLLQHLLATMTSKEEKIYLVCEKIDDLRGTFFRQTGFAEFELFLHEQTEKGNPLTPKLLRDKYQEIITASFGPSIIFDEEISTEWARIPHFYYNFYVYQYATGIAAALALNERVVKGGAQERDDYLSFLKSGSSAYPIDTLKKAGVDMESKEPILATIRKFKNLVETLKNLTYSTSRSNNS